MPRNKKPSIAHKVEPLMMKFKTNKEISVILDEPLWRIQNSTGYIKRKWKDNMKKINHIHKLKMRGSKNETT
jgi:hypothetical protein